MNRLLPAAILIAATPLTACSRPAEPARSGPQTTTVEISYDDLLSQKHVKRAYDLSVGDYLQVSLAANASTGYRWAEQMTISDPKVLAQTGHVAVASSKPVPGSPGSEVWMLQAMAPGVTTVTTSYGRPWEGGEQDAWTFTADVTVK